MSDQKVPKPVTSLVRICGNTFALTRRGGHVDIRALPKPKAPARPCLAQVVRLDGKG